MIEEGMNIKGAITLLLAKASGEVEVVHKENIIVNGGFDFVADAIGNSSSRPGVMGWIALGTGTTAAAATQTALVTEIKRNAATYAHTAGTKVFTFTASYPAGDATGAITEAGVFNAVLASHCTFNALDDGRNWGAIVFKLLSYICDVDTFAAAYVFVVSAFVCILKTSPTTNVVNQHTFEVCISIFNILNQLL